jgi:hypothetical protein
LKEIKKTQGSRKQSILKRKIKKEERKGEDMKKSEEIGIIKIIGERDRVIIEMMKILNQINNNNDQTMLIYMP